MEDSGLKQLVDDVRRLVDQAEPLLAASLAPNDPQRVFLYRVRLLCQGTDELLKSKQDLQGRLSRKPASTESHIDVLHQWAERHGVDLSQDAPASHP